VRKGNELRLRWDAVPGVEDYCVFGSPKPGCDVESAVPIGTTADTSWTVDPAGPDLHYRVTARARGVAGLPSVEVGRAPGSIRWRFVNSGWFLASPALGDLDADGRLDIVIGSYNGRVYALTADGDLLWEFDTADTVFASAAIAPLRPGEPPSIVVNSSRALYVLSARGQVRWQHEGIRQYDRNTKSPAVGDLDGDGQAEVVVTSDTGEVLAFAADGHLLWRHATAGPQNAGLNIGTPTMVELPEGGRGVVFAADDGYLRLVNHEGQLVWKHAFGDSSQLVGPVPSHQFVAAGRLETNGVMRIASGMGGLQMLDLAGKVLWHRGDVHGVPSIARIGDHPTPCIALVAGPLLRVLDQEGKDVWQYQLERPQDFFTHSPVVADLDADGGPDLLVGSRATRLYALSGQGRLLWSFPTADELSSSPAVADLDHDGFAEVVLASRDGYVYVLGAGPVSPGAQRSLEYRANPARTGEYLGP
jgi:outer membrane protein assembly factor BamB